MKIIICVALCLTAISTVSGTPSEYNDYKTKRLPENIELEFSSPSSPRNKRTIGIFTSFLNAFTNTLQRSNPPPQPPPPPPPARPAPRNNNNAINNNGNVIGYSVFAGLQPITGVISINPLPNPTPAPPAPAGMGAAAAPPPPPTRPMAPRGQPRNNIPLAIAPAPTTMPPPPPPPPTTMPPPPPTMAAAPPPTTGAPPTTTDLLPGGEETTLGGDSAQSTTFGDEGDDDYIDSSTEVEDDNENAISPKAAARTQSSSSSSEFDQSYNNNNYWINPSPPAWFRNGAFYSDSREEDTDSSNGVKTVGIKYSEPIRQQHNKHNRNYNTKSNVGNEFERQQYYNPQQYQQFKSVNYQPFAATTGTTGGATSGTTFGGYEFNVPDYSAKQPEYTMPASHSRVKMHDNGFDQFTYHDHRFGAQPSYRVEYHGKRDWA